MQGSVDLTPREITIDFCPEVYSCIAKFDLETNPSFAD